MALFLCRQRQIGVMIEVVKNKKLGNYAFIDSQNLNLGLRVSDGLWIMVVLENTCQTSTE